MRLVCNAVTIDSMPPTWTMATSFSGTRPKCLSAKRAPTSIDVPKRVMPTDLPLSCSGFLNLRARHQILHESIEGRADDHDIGAAQCRAGGGAAGDLQKLQFAGDQRIHAFDAGGRGDDFDIQAMLIENPQLASDPRRTHDRRQRGERHAHFAQGLSIRREGVGWSEQGSAPETRNRTSDGPSN